MKQIDVCSVKFPSIEGGIASFYRKADDASCAEPSRPSDHGCCHLVGEELDELAVKLGFLTRDAYAKWFGPGWEGYYGQELSRKIGQTLETFGIVLEIKGEAVQFVCSPGEFVRY
ncbi:hypothetical protein [Exiguobacterium flavidum]|uniref:hypothetical protein n=1 Tax=Exiguobacterium flavidum TaxID=2184695 RepID=UPI000DF82BB6|nr:hypothetical protein [Exiguobacterium flavidum]